MKLNKKYVTKVFEVLKEGKFLSQNSPNKDKKELYEYVEDHSKELQEYFSYIGLELVVANSYAYFASLSNKEKKLESIYELIDILSFFYNYSLAFDVGFRFSVSDIEQKVKDNATFEMQLKKLKISGETLREKILTLISKLEKRGFIEVESEYHQRYVVLNSFEYLVKFFNKIEIR